MSFAVLETSAGYQFACELSIAFQNLTQQVAFDRGLIGPMRTHPAFCSLQASTWLNGLLDRAYNLDVREPTQAEKNVAAPLVRRYDAPAGQSGLTRVLLLVVLEFQGPQSDVDEYSHGYVEEALCWRAMATETCMQQLVDEMARIRNAQSG